jgi:hypothetical protein
MKAAFVVGFSPAVRNTLESEFKDAIANRTLVCISQGQGIGADLAKFKEVFLSRVCGETLKEVIILFAVAPHSSWADDAIGAIAGDGRRRCSSCLIALDVIRDFGAINQVRNRVAALKLTEVQGISEEQIRSKLGSDKVICVSAQGRTSVLSALERAGFPASVLAQQFEEEIISPSTNSMLMAYLEKFSKTHHHMLYAWQGLRTSSKGLIRAFKKRGSFFEADSAAKLAEAFRKFISK